MNEARWHQLMSQWGAPTSDDVYWKLFSAYSEPHRRYHGVHHIGDCLAQFDDASTIADAPEEVELALWFHDAIYEPTSSHNEMQSAEWAATFLRAVDAVEDATSRVYRYILATKHSAESLSGDAALVVDVDLSILGRGMQQFETYEKSIRKEYKLVPQPIYRHGGDALLADPCVSRPGVIPRARSSIYTSTKPARYIFRRYCPPTW